MHTPAFIHDQELEGVSRHKFLGVLVAEDLTWATNISALVQKEHKHMLFLRKF